MLLYQVRKDDTESLNDEIEQLQGRHAELLMQADGVRDKVDASKVQSL